MKKFLLLMCIFSASLLLVFPGMMSGKILHNCVYKYHFEPWAHHKNLIGDGVENPIISDSIDGADANLSPSNVSLFSIGESLQIHKRVTAVLMRFFSSPTALSIVYWLTFALCFFSLFNFLDAWKVPTAINLALSLGFTYGSTNNHFYAYGTLTAFGVTCFWFLERLIQTRKVLWLVLLTLALINLCGAEMIHVVAFYSFSLFAYAVFRLCVLPEKRKETFLLVILSFVFSILMSSDYLYPTAYHYLFNFEKGYREGYGLRQNSPISFVTLFFSRIFGDPILEQSRWPGGTFLTTSLFMGSLAAFSLAAVLIPRKWPKGLFSCLLFFVAMTVIAAGYQYEFPYENFEDILAAIPPFKWAPPLYFKAVFHFFLIVIAAFSLKNICEGGLAERAQKWGTVAVMLVPLGASIFIFYKHYALNGPSVWTLNFFREAMVFIILTVILLSAIIFGSVRVKRIACLLLVPLAALEARAHTRGWFPQADPSSCYPRTAVTDFLHAHNDGGRIQGLGRAAIPAIISPSTYGLETAVGRMSISPGLTALLRQVDPLAYKNHATQYLFAESTLLDHPVWELLNVRFFICRKAFTEADAHYYDSGKSLKFNYLSDGLVIERASKSSPAVFRTSWITTRDEEHMESILRDRYDWSNNVIINVSDESRMEAYTSPEAPQHEQAAILDHQENKNEFVLKVSQTNPGLWVLSERWDPLWTVTVDGEIIKPVRAYYSLMSIPVERGTHTIILTYGLPGFFVANLFTGLATLIFFALAAVLFVKEKSVGSTGMRSHA